MKKKLEADLMSIAHRVLQMKNKSDINQLCIETRKLYEKLAILQFVEEHFGDVKPTIGQAEIVEKMKYFFEEIHITDPLINSVQEEIIVDKALEEKIVVEKIKEEVVIDEVPEEEVVIDEIPEEEIETIVEEQIEMDKSKDLGFLPTFELDVEVEEETPKKQEVQISFIDLLGSDYDEPLFIKVDPSEEVSSEIAFDLPKEANFQFDKEEPVAKVDSSSKKNEPKSVSLNDTFAKGINIGLNDRIAFVKHLFGNSDEDYNRVMNQLITYDNFEEAQKFIDDMVKPDYNSWEGKEDYSQRFIEIIEKKFA